MTRPPMFLWLVARVALAAAVMVALSAAPACAQAEDPGRQQEEDEDNGEGMRRFWNRFRRPSIYQRMHDSVKEPFAAVIGKASRSTVRVLAGEEQAALGTVVAAGGLVLTKASELRDGEGLICELFDGRRLKARQVGASEDYDLALLKVDADGLSPVDWVSAKLPVGTWLVTPGIDDAPVSIGVVSTAARQIPRSRALLGVRLGENPQDSRGGARVGMVFPNSGAQQAGVEVGDVIVGADDAEIKSPEDLIAHVSGLLPGDRVRLKILRGDEKKSLTAELTDEEALSQSRVEVQNSLGGPISRRRSGFPLVLQHDSVLRPEQCGGPLLNLDGKVVGMNIARAGRVGSYAVPAADVVRLLPQLLSSVEAFRDQERTQQIADLERDIEKWKEHVDVYRMRLEAAENKVAAEGRPAEVVAAAKKEVGKFQQLVDEARQRVERLEAEVAGLRGQSPQASAQ